MISRWLICSNVVYFGLIATVAALPANAGAVKGKVELRDSRDPAVRNRSDYSGVVITLKSVKGGPSAAPGKATIVQKDKTFTPHVLAVPVGTLVDFPNFDPIFHNAFSSYSGQVFDIGLYPPGSTRAVRFTREGVVRVFCNIHASMSAMIVVVSTPYFAVTKRDGSFELPSVPGGEYDLSVFHERATGSVLQASERKVTIGGDALALPVISISEAGYLSIPHKDKYGHDYHDTDGHSMYPSPVK
ncbi:MAG: hypothetical protein ABL995_11405 [Bryobacteraceae bacterium]